MTEKAGWEERKSRTGMTEKAGREGREVSVEGGWVWAADGVAARGFVNGRGRREAVEG